MEEDSPKPNITIAVEGNIGSGKTTLLNFFRDNPLVEVLEEPVAKWQNVGGKNLLELFYTDCQRWSYLFESCAVLSLMKIHKKPHVTPVKMIERSVYSGYYCFEHNLCKSGMMTKAEHSVHNEWFEWITRRQQPHLDLIIYLRTSPEICMERMKARCRSEEKTIPMVGDSILFTIKNFTLKEVSHLLFISRKVTVCRCKTSVISNAQLALTCRSQCKFHTIF